MNNICIRVDAYSEIGFGHMVRCLILAKALRARDKYVFFYLQGSIQAKRMIEKAGFEYVSISLGKTFFDQTKDLERDGVAPVVIADIAHARAIANPNEVVRYLDRLYERSYVMLIDAFGDQSLRKRCSRVPCHILVAPYVGEKASDSQPTYLEVLGGEYFILGDSYHSLPEKHIRQFADKVLITCGGSDPTGMSIQILNALNVAMQKYVSIKVVVGGGFSNELKDALESAVSESKHNVMLISGIDDLSPEMLWADVVISSTGLTKYELATTGTPSILMSIDDSHDLVNQYFACEKTALDLGVANNVPDEVVADKTSMLLDDHDARLSMSENGRRLVDGQGVNKLIDLLFQKDGVTG